MPPSNKTYKKGSFLFREGDLSKDLYIVQSGNVRVFRTENSNPIEICKLSKGAVLGEMALIDGRPRSASVEALDDTEVSILASDDFSQKAKGIPGWFMSVLKIVIQRLRESNKRLHSAIAQNKIGNIATVLLLVYNRFKETVEGKDSLDVRVAKQEIIKILEIPLAELNKCMDELRQNLMITVEKNRIVIENVEQFRKYARFLRIRETGADSAQSQISHPARDMLLYLYNVRTQKGSQTPEGIAFTFNEISEEIKQIIGTDPKSALEELVEREFCSIADGSGSEKSAKGITVFAKESRMEEFALLQEFSGKAA